MASPLPKLINQIGGEERKKEKSQRSAVSIVFHTVRVCVCVRAREGPSKSKYGEGKDDMEPLHHVTRSVVISTALFNDSSWTR